MSRFAYLFYGLMVVIVSTAVNLSYTEENNSSGRNYGSSGRSSGWSSGGGHK
ncbi:MAG TPA: hypothetical protein VM532_10155 [Burkholderiales bacterium]|nr:hypothetical protein [Burkholderiales bacterium]